MKKIIVFVSQWWNKKIRFGILSLMGCLILMGRITAVQAQGCCAGGSGNPIAGGATPGVLAFQQLELSTNFQYINSSSFKSKSKKIEPLFDNYNTTYLYSKAAYGITKELTMSVELGYFFNKTQISLDKSETIKASGISDLILFPRYNIYNKTDSSKLWDLTVGLGYKMPLGKSDIQTLVYTNPTTGEKLFTTAPPLVQPTTGSHDLILYAFALRGFTKSNFKIFANATYIAKGWNSLGEKFGDFSSIGLFASKTWFKKTGFTLQLRGENVSKMRAAKNMDVLALYNVDTASTGNKRILLSPQITYNLKNFTFYGLYEIPVYEYVNGGQVATQTQVTMGLSYRFFTVKNPVCPPDMETGYYECPMKCEGIRSAKPGKCRICGMEFIKAN